MFFYSRILFSFYPKLFFSFSSRTFSSLVYEHRAQQIRHQTRDGLFHGGLLGLVTFRRLSGPQNREFKQQLIRLTGGAKTPKKCCRIEKPFLFSIFETIWATFWLFHIATIFSASWRYLPFTLLTLGTKNLKCHFCA